MKMYRLQVVTTETTLRRTGRLFVIDLNAVLLGEQVAVSAPCWPARHLPQRRPSSPSELCYQTHLPSWRDPVLPRVHLQQVRLSARGVEQRERGRVHKPDLGGFTRRNLC